jgi:hypothetical protein
MESSKPNAIEELLKLDHYRPEELARLLDLNVDVICSAAFSGDLVATIVGHDVVDIRRQDALRWLADQR